MFEESKEGTVLKDIRFDATLVNSFVVTVESQEQWDMSEEDEPILTQFSMSKSGCKALTNQDSLLL